MLKGRMVALAQLSAFWGRLSSCLLVADPSNARDRRR